MKTQENPGETGVFLKKRQARPTGLEPATTGSTVQYSNQLSYGPRVDGSAAISCWETLNYNYLLGGRKASGAVGMPIFFLAEAGGWGREGELVLQR